MRITNRPQRNAKHRRGFGGGENFLHLEIPYTFQASVAKRKHAEVDPHFTLVAR